MQIRIFSARSPRRQRLYMHILIIGAAGMVGRKLTRRLVADGRIGEAHLSRLTLADVLEPDVPDGFAGEVDTVAADLSEPGVAERLAAARPDIIYHLAAIVSGEAEADFDKGYRINLDGTRLLFEAIRRSEPALKPRLVFTSSLPCSARRSPT